jgi:hypothetical protein
MRWNDILDNDTFIPFPVAGFIAIGTMSLPQDIPWSRKMMLETDCEAERNEALSQSRMTWPFLCL